MHADTYVSSSNHTHSTGPEHALERAWEHMRFIPTPTALVPDGQLHPTDTHSTDLLHAIPSTHSTGPEQAHVNMSMPSMPPTPIALVRDGQVHRTEGP